MVCVGRFPPGKERHLDNKFVRQPHRIGNSYLLYGVKDSHFPLHCFVGPEWPCMLCTYSLIIVPTIFFLVNVATLWSNSAVLAIGVITFLAVLIAFSATACTEPGIIFVPSLYIPHSGGDKSELGEAGLQTRSVGTFECNICNIERPRTASHCYECGVCVDQLDHHCPWTGKCIARKNLRCFYLFLTTLLVHITFVVAIFAASLAQRYDIFPSDGSQ